MPQRDLEAGVLRREDDFHGSGVNQIDSCLFLQSSNLGLHRSWTFLLFLYKNSNSLIRMGEVSENITMIKRQILS